MREAVTSGVNTLSRGFQLEHVFLSVQDSSDHLSAFLLADFTKTSLVLQILRFAWGGNPEDFQVPLAKKVAT